MNLNDYCIGHIVKPLVRCSTCKYDEKNLNCPIYDPSKIEIIKVKEDEKHILRMIINYKPEK